MDVSPANHEEVYTSAQVLLTSPEDIVRTVEVTLYFPDELGNLTAEERRLTVYEGETPAEAVVKALTERPMDIYAGLERLLPKGFTALAASVEDGTCYLNLPGSVVSLLPEDSQKQRIMLEGLVNSLCSLEGVEQVQILLNGDYQNAAGHPARQPPAAAHGVKCDRNRRLCMAQTPVCCKNIPDAPKAAPSCGFLTI